VSVTVSPSASARVAVAVSVWLVFGEAGDRDTVAVGSEFATVAESLTVEPLAAPSPGVTSTETVSPLSPWPAPERSSVSVAEAEPAVVLTTVEPTFQT
jgi:hypothetical protein